MLSEFKIQEQSFSADPNADISTKFVVKSFPRPYSVTFLSSENPGQNLAAAIVKEKAPLLLIDKKIHQLYFKDIKELSAVPTFMVDATEEKKEITTVMEVVDFLEKNHATKASMLYVVGGGILQDIGAFAGSMYKRGLPWILVPTTLLSQGDSCVGGKTALNHKRTKNLLALFSAPRQIIIDAGFLNTLPKDDIFSGVGEIFRLCITGGKDFLNIFVEKLPAFLRGDMNATTNLIAVSLLAKRAVVEFDEFELDLRRSMNYGHSFGHALEALSNYRIPHGVGVTIGILVENEIAYQRNMLSKEERDQLLKIGSQIIPNNFLKIFIDTPLDGILDLLRRDKKTDGAVLKLATLESIGQMRFIDLALDKTGEEEVRKAVNQVIKYLSL